MWGSEEKRPGADLARPTHIWWGRAVCRWAAPGRFSFSDRCHRRRAVAARTAVAFFVWWCIRAGFSFLVAVNWFHDEGRDRRLQELDSLAKTSENPAVTGFQGLVKNENLEKHWLPRPRAWLTSRPSDTPAASSPPQLCPHLSIDGGQRRRHFPLPTALRA